MIAVVLCNKIFLG